MEPANTANELIYIQTSALTLTIKGPSSHPSFPGTEFNTKDASVRVECEDSFEIDMAADYEMQAMQTLSRVRVARYGLRPLFFEQQRYELVIEPVSGHKAEFWHENYNIRRNVTPVGRNSQLLSGIINFGNEIGMSDLIVRLDGRPYLKLTLEVFPSKIGYKDDYKAIVADVTAEVYNLVFDFLKKTYESFDISSKQSSSPVEFYAIIRKIYFDFLTAADLVIAKPHHVLETEHVVLPSHKIRRTDNRTLRWIEKHPDQTLRSDQTVLVDRALAVKKHVTYDTNENRLTKYMLMNTALRLEHFKKLYLLIARETDLATLYELDRMIKSIRRRVESGFMKTVEAAPSNASMSLVFNMAPGYRELYRDYLLLQHGLSVSGSLFNTSVKDLAILYEYWCFIKLNSLMRQRYELISQDIIKVAGNGLYVSLVKGQRSRVRYRNPENGEIIELSYNPKVIAVPTVSQKPDNVLSLKKKGAKVKYEYIFDAKYKINPALDGSTYKQLYQTPGPQEEDINIMHRYRDAIVYHSVTSSAETLQMTGRQGEDIDTLRRARDASIDRTEASPNAMPKKLGRKEDGISTLHRDRKPFASPKYDSSYERTMFGAYVLFPYRNQEEYKQHRFYKSIDEVNIGGLPFLPSATDLVTQMLDELIADSPESAFERATLPRGIEEKLAKVDWNRRDVLIGTLRSDAQLQICLKKRFYYIPQKLVADKELPIRYVALFQTPRVFSEKAGISFYGEVLRTALVRRKSIREVAMRKGTDPEELYYRFVIQDWIPMKKPILPKESGFVREFTNNFLLENAEFVPELLLRSEEEYRFYMELKRRTGMTLEDNEDKPGFEIGELKVLFEDGEIKIYRHSNIVARCSVLDFSRYPSATFRRMLRYALTMG